MELDERSIIKLANELSDQMNFALIPIEIDLWSTKQVAAFLKVSEKQARERYCCKADFPLAIRISTGTGTRNGHPRWRAKEVINWANKYIDKRHQLQKRSKKNGSN